MKKNITVYTCGTYDMFHIGHLNILKYAKGLGDKLIVGISTDELVEQYKGRKPIVPFEERMRIVSEMKCVDLCVPQSDRDKFTAWEKMGFDIWVVGDDWFNDNYYMNLKSKFDKVGVKTVFLPYTKGVSSTIRRKKIQNNFV